MHTAVCQQFCFNKIIKELLCEKKNLREYEYVLVTLYTYITLIPYFM